MSGVDEFWSQLSDGQGMYFCPNKCCDNRGAAKTLKPRISNTAKNPGRVFVSCSEQYGGCGLFCWLAEEPNPVALKSVQPSAPKRARTDATSHDGNMITANPQQLAMPDATQKALSDLHAKVDQLTTLVLSLAQRGYQ